MTRLLILAGLALLPALAAGEAQAQGRPAPVPSERPREAPRTAPRVAPRVAPGDTAVRDTAAKPPSPLDAAADSVIQVLRALPGYVATEYEGESATYRTDEGVLTLRGKATVDREGDRLTADTIEYRNQRQLIRATGAPQVAGRSQELKGNVLFYDLATRRATALGAETKVAQGANWIVRGDVTAEDQTETVFATHAAFTTCDLAIPHYHFESDRVKVVRNKYLVARPARLYFGKVPVMVLPFVVQNLEKGRRSGLVVPRFSLTDIVRNSAGHTRQISDLGWYWAVNEYLGAQLSTTWRSGAYTALHGNVDYNWRRQFLNGHFGIERFWEDDGGRNLSLNTSTSWRPDERTSLAVSGNYARDASFIRDATFDPLEATQNLMSTLSLSRRFDWGTMSMGGTRTQQISDGSVRMTLPSFTLSPNPITLFRAATEEQARWFSNSSINWGLSGTRQSVTGTSDYLRRIQDYTQTQVQGGLQSFTIGKLSLSATGTLDQQILDEVIGTDTTGVPIAGARIPGGHLDRASWQMSLGFQQNLKGQTVITPNLGLSQELRRDSLTSNRYLQAPMRLNFGASMSTALFGFYPGVGPFSAIRHRLTPTVSYSYSPQVRQTELQDTVFGRIGGLAQNIVVLSLSQTWEAKLKEPREPTQPDSAARAAATDTTAARQAVPAEPQKVTLLSISTSAISYDFNRAADPQGGSGFLSPILSNSITSDYLQGLQVQVQHELFDASRVDPNDSRMRGSLGTFSPRLSQLSTGFELGPSSALFRWLGLGDDRTPQTQGVQPGAPPTPSATPAGSSGFTGNPQPVGGGDWRLGIQYAFTRQPRTFTRQAEPVDRSRFFRRRTYRETEQTVMADLAFSLTPNWGVTWNTGYSVADGEFSGHRLNFRRDLHRWQANFSFYKTPDGNSAFEFFVELIDNRDLKVNYRDYNLGVDRRRR